MNAKKAIAGSDQPIKEFYVYELRDDQGKVFYVGKGKGKRAYEHRWLATYWKKKSHLYSKIKKLWSEGLDFTEVIVFTTLVEKEAFDEEVRLIAFYGRINLTNMTDGGEGSAGHIKTEESIRKHKEAVHRGDDHYLRKNPHLAKRGKDHPMVKNPENACRGEKHRLRMFPEQILRGENAPVVKLTTESVLQIRRDYASGFFTYKTLGVKFGVCGGTIQAIVNGRNWSHVPFEEGFPAIKKKRDKMTPEMVREARRLISEGLSQSEVGRRVGIDQGCISAMVNGKSWKHIQ